MKRLLLLKHKAVTRGNPILAFRLDEDYRLEIKEGEIWAMIGNNAFDLRIFLEDVVNASNHSLNRCAFYQTDILPNQLDVYYIHSTNMMFDSMNVLEYLAFTLKYKKAEVNVKIDQIHRDLIDLGLSVFAELGIHQLTPSQKSIIELLSGLYRKERLVIWNLERLQYDNEGIIAIQSILSEYQRQRRAVLFSSFDYQMIEACATHVAPLYDGMIVSAMTLDKFIDTWDHLCAVIKDERAEEMQHYLNQQCPQFQTVRDDDTLQIYDQSHSVASFDIICATLGKKYYYPKYIEQQPYGVGEAWKELAHHYELQKKT